MHSGRSHARGIALIRTGDRVRSAWRGASGDQGDLGRGWATGRGPRRRALEAAGARTSRERQWGTVREDYSDRRHAWAYFSHDQARSRTYRWGEDGLAGISDDRQRLCFALALWNGHDPILKERLFGLTNSEGNHGEDVKEYYFYLDSTPTHSYMKYLYKYPQAAFPYGDLVATNRRRGKHDHEYELLDTGVFDQDRYFDVYVEYAKAAPEDLMSRSPCRTGPEAATLHLLPTLWFRNTWSWGETQRPVIARRRRPRRRRLPATAEASTRRSGSAASPPRGSPTPVHRERDNTERLAGLPNHTPYVKDAFHAYLVDGGAMPVTRPGLGPRRRHTTASTSSPARRPRCVSGSGSPPATRPPRRRATAIGPRRSRPTGTIAKASSAPRWTPWWTPAAPRPMPSTPPSS